MSDDVRIKVTATDDASDELRKIGRAGQEMGRDVEQAGKRADAGLKGVGRSASEAERGMRGFAQSGRQVGDALDDIGAAVGAVVGGMALLGRNNLDAQRSVDGLRRAYGDAADEILTFSERIQDTTNFSNDAARAAALTGASLAQNYGLAADEINQLIEVSANLATIHGTTLPDAMSRVAGAIRGEGEAAELLGLNMSDAAVAAAAAAQGLDGWRTTMTEAEKAAFRYSLVLEQSAFATGAAGDAASGAAGKGHDFVAFLDDAAESAGNALGPTGEFLAVLGDVAIILPVAGAAFGKMAQGALSLNQSIRALAGGQAAARLATLPLTAALGPLGLAAATAAAGFAILKLGDELGGEYVEGARLAEQTTGDLTTRIKELAVAGAPTGQITELVALRDLYAELAEAAVRAQEEAQGYADAVQYQPQQPGDRDALLADLRAIEAQYGTTVDRIDDATRSIDESLTAITGYAGENAAAVRQAAEDILRAVQAGTITYAEGAQQLDALAEGMRSYGATLPGVYTAIASLTDAQREFAVGMGLGVEQVEAMAEAAPQATLTLDQMVAALTQHAAAAERSAAAQAELVDLVDILQGHARQGALAAIEADAAALERLVGQREGIVALAAAERDLAQAANEAAAARIAGTEAVAAAAHEQLADAIGGTVAALSDYQAALALANDGVWSLTDAMALNVAMQGELNGVNSQYTTQIRALEDARDVLLERQAAGIALSQQELAFLAEVDATVGRLTGTVDDNTVAIGLQAQAWAENEQATGGVRAEWDQLPATMAGVDESISELAEAIRDLAEATLGVDFSKLRVPEDVIGSFHELRDAMAEAAGGPDALNAALTAGYNTGTAGESLTPAPAAGPAPGAPQIPGPMVVQVVADTAPADAQIADFIGRALDALAGGDFTAVIEADPTPAEASVAQASAALDAFVGADHTAVIQADGAPAHASIAEVAANLGAVTKAQWVATLGVDNTPALGGIEAAIGALRNFDASSGTVDLYANDYAAGVIASRLGYQGDAYINVYAIPVGGPGVSPLSPGVYYAHGGVVPAAHGRVVEMAEHMPELVYPPGGRPWLAAMHGLYVAPGGSYVSPGPATAATLGGLGGVNIHIHGNIYGEGHFRDTIERVALDAVSAGLALAGQERRTALGMV